MFFLVSETRRCHLHFKGHNYPLGCSAKSNAFSSNIFQAHSQYSKRSCPENVGYLCAHLHLIFFIINSRTMQFLLPVTIALLRKDYRLSQNINQF